MKLVIATQNQGKLKEIQTLLDLPELEIISLADFDFVPDLQEPHQSYIENAREKAKTIAEFSQAWALADDSGLEVLALDQQPGVYSARYAGENATALENNLKLLKNLEGVPFANRQAEFICCMVLRSPRGEEYSTEGKLTGLIANEMRGEKGFGYDPLFFIPEKKQVLAEMSSEEKNQISHRRQALEKMKHFLIKKIHNG